MKINPEQIVRQLTLLRSMAHLLMTQKEPKAHYLEKYGWSYSSAVANYKNTSRGICQSIPWRQAWNHPITQKAWSDELLDVVKNLINEDNISKYTIGFILDIQSESGTDVLKHDYNDALENILNKYGRSLNE